MFIVLTGNFSFSNLLIVTLSISLLDDQFFFVKSKKNGSFVWDILGIITNLLIHGAIIYGVVNLYQLKLNGSQIDADISKCSFLGCFLNYLFNCF